MRAAQLKWRLRHFANFMGLSVEQLVAAAVAATALESQDERSRQRALGGGRKAKPGVQSQGVVAWV